MIINPKEIIDKKIVNGFLNINNQLQQNGIDLTVKDIKEVVGEGVLTISDTKLNERKDVLVKDNKYRLETFKTFDILFNEYVKIPKDMCAMIITRSSLNRMGAFVLSGVYDSGFENYIGCILRTHSTNVVFEKNVRIAQIVFFKADSASLYNGKYHVDSKK